MKYLELFRSIYNPQQSEVVGSFSESMDSIISDCAARGWSHLNGADYAKINKLGRRTLKEESELIWNCFCEAYDASDIKPEEQTVRKIIEDTLQDNASSIIANIIIEIGQQNINMQLPDLEGQKEFTIREIEEEKRHLGHLISGKLNIFFAKLNLKKENPLILKPAFFGIGIDLSKLKSWFVRK